MFASFLHFLCRICEKWVSICVCLNGFSNCNLDTYLVGVPSGSFYSIGFFLSWRQKRWEWKRYGRSRGNFNYLCFYFLASMILFCVSYARKFSALFFKCYTSSEHSLHIVTSHTFTHFSSWIFWRTYLDHVDQILFFSFMSSLSSCFFVSLSSCLPTSRGLHATKWQNENEICWQNDSWRTQTKNLKKLSVFHHPNYLQVYMECILSVLTPL